MYFCGTFDSMILTLIAKSLDILVLMRSTSEIPQDHSWIQDSFKAFPQDTRLCHYTLRV